MKNFARRAFCSAFALAIAFSAVGCATPDDIGGNTPQIQVDEKRTQLYVFNFDGGYGSEWMATAIEQYEKLHATDKWEEGKVGVQIIPTHTKKGREGAEVLANKEEVYFTESVQYYQSINDGAFADITDAIVGANPYETDKTIESKMTAEQKSYYGYQKDGQTRYYGIPHYSGAFGIAYDIDLFDSKGYYFKEGYNKDDALEDKFIYEKTDEKTAGPNGVKGDSDDGLPVTYEEFFWLCDYISGMNVTPISWSGANYGEYITMLYNQLVVNDMGLKEASLAFTMSGPTANLGTVDANGNFVKDANPTTITKDNAYELYRHESKYEALKFLEKLIETEKYLNEGAFTNTYEHTTAQDDFLWSGKDGYSEPIAMLADGAWWQSEANETFKAMESQQEAWSKNNRNIGWMPLPKSSAKNQKNVYFDHLYSSSFIKANIAEWKLPLAIDFLQFCNTDETMRMFTKTTNTPKAFNYEMSAADMEDLTPFGRSLLNYKQNADVLYPVSSEAKFLNNQAMFTAGGRYKSTLDIDQSFPSITFHEKKSVSAADYFKGMYTYYQATWSKLK